MHDKKRAAICHAAAITSLSLIASAIFMKSKYIESLAIISTIKAPIWLKLAACLSVAVWVSLCVNVSMPLSLHPSAIYWLSGLTFQPSRCRALVRGCLTFTCGWLLVFKLNITTTKINSRHWPGPGAGSYHSPSFLPVSLFFFLFFFCPAFSVSPSVSGVLSPMCLCACVQYTRMKPGSQLWLEQGGAGVSACSKEHTAHCLERLRERDSEAGEKWGKEI